MLQADLWSLLDIIAAGFVAVFFIASEGAQLLFGDRWGTYAGLLAAGALVFAIAPLQRAADRLAERAVPVERAATTSGSSDEREAAYRGIVRLALRDRLLIRHEERALLRAAEEMGIPMARATAILDEMERVVGGGAR